MSCSSQVAVDIEVQGRQWESRATETMEPIAESSAPTAEHHCMEARAPKIICFSDAVALVKERKERETNHEERIESVNFDDSYTWLFRQLIEHMNDLKLQTNYLCFGWTMWTWTRGG